VRGWRTAQKIAFLVGLSVVIAVVARLVLAPDPLKGDGGWFNYAPNSGLTYSPSSSRSPIAVAAVWIVATALWTAVAVWLLGRRDDD